MLSNRDIPISDIEPQKLPKTNYFEFHIKAILPVDENLEILRKYCLQRDAHLSANAFKKLVDGKQHRFITMRAYAVGYKSAQRMFEKSN